MRLRDLLGTYRPFCDATDEGGGGGSGGEGGGEDGGEGGGGGSGGEPYFPEGIPDNWRGEDNQATIDALFGVAKGYRDAEASKPALPKSVDDLSYEPSESLAPFMHDQSDPVLTNFKTAAVKHGLSNEQFQGVLEETLGPLVADGLIATPYDAKAELTALGKSLSLDNKGVSEAVTGATAFAEGLARQLDDVPEQHKEAVADRIAEMADDHIGVMALRALQSRLQKGGIRVEGKTVQQGGLTKEELNRLDRDDRIDPQSPKYDPDLRKKYDEGYKQLHAG